MIEITVSLPKEVIQMSNAKRNPRNAESAELEEQVEARIRQRAYELYEQRGRDDGHDWEDWLTAESEVARREKQAA